MTHEGLPGPDELLQDVETLAGISRPSRTYQEYVAGEQARDAKDYEKQKAEVLKKIKSITLLDIIVFPARVATRIFRGDRRSN